MYRRQASYYFIASANWPPNRDRETREEATESATASAPLSIFNGSN